MTERGRDVAAQLAGPGEGTVDLRPRGGIVPCLGPRRAQQVRDAAVVDVGARPRQARESLGLDGPGRGACGDLLEQGGRALGPAALEVVLGRLGGPAAGIFAVVRRRQGTRALGQLERRLDGASAVGSERRAFEDGGHAGVGLLGGERQVSRPLLGVREGGGEAAMKLAPLIGRDLGLEDRCEQRVRQPEPGLPPRDDRRAERSRQVVPAARTEHRLDDRRCRLGQARRDQGRGAGSRGEALESIAYERPEALGNRKRLTNLQPAAARPRPPHELEREQGIAAADAVKPNQVALGDDRCQARADEPAKLAGGERADREPLHAVFRESFDQRRQRRLGRRIHPPREERADRLALEAPEEEAEHPFRVAVQVRHVVDRHEDRLVDRESPKRVQRAEADGEGRRRGSAGLRSLQGDLQSVPLRRGKAGQRGVGHGLEEARQARERELRLGLDRPAREHPEAVLCGRAPTRVPQRGLADAGGALEHHDHGAPTHVGREPGQVTTLGLAADEQGFFGGARHGGSSLT